MGADFGNKSREELISTLVLRKEFIPKSLLMPKSLFMEAGGMPHDMPMNVDWELELRAARVPGNGDIRESPDIISQFTFLP